MPGYLSLEVICLLKLTENCLLLGTDNVRGDISEHTFASMTCVRRGGFVVSLLNLESWNLSLRPGYAGMHVVLCPFAGQIALTVPLRRTKE